jgi:hypothetical protein
MGIAGADLVTMMKLRQAGHLANGARILDLGAQNLFCAGSENVVREFVRVFAPGLNVEPAQIDKLANGGYAGELFTLVGFNYTCFDVFAAPHGVVFDLNFDSVPAEFAGKFDLVMNHGTTEHLLNQFHAFNVVHDLTKAGGVMIHSLPFQGYFDHGFFSYSGKFFHRLAQFNGYKMVELGFSETEKGATTPPYVLSASSSMRPGGRYHSRALNDAGVYAILRKQSDVDFVPPLDIDIGNTRKEDIEALMARSREYAGKQGPIRAGQAARAIAFAHAARPSLARRLFRWGYRLLQRTAIVR